MNFIEQCLLHCVNWKLIMSLIERFDTVNQVYKILVLKELDCQATLYRSYHALFNGQEVTILLFNPGLDKHEQPIKNLIKQLTKLQEEQIPGVAKFIKAITIKENKQWIIIQQSSRHNLRKHVLQQPYICKVLLEVISVLEEVHKTGRLHLALRLQSIFIGKNQTVCIKDFYLGLLQSFQNQPSVAPELKSAVPHPSINSDVYSVSLIVLECFSRVDIKKLIASQNKRFEDLLGFYKQLCGKLKDQMLIQKILRGLRVNPLERLALNQFSYQFEFILVRENSLHYNDEEQKQIQQVLRDFVDLFQAKVKLKVTKQEKIPKNLNQASLLVQEVYRLCAGQHFTLGFNKIQGLVVADLAPLRLGRNAVQLLISGQWPNLKSISLSWNGLTKHQIQILSSGAWPLRQLNLCSKIIRRQLNPIIRSALTSKIQLAKLGQYRFKSFNDQVGIAWALKGRGKTSMSLAQPGIRLVHQEFKL